jgi:hypothetical protein
MPPQISLTELYSIKNKRELSKHSTYDKIIELCHEKIKKIALTGGMNIFYEVPYIIIGLPLYDINLCVEYVVNSLRKNGLLVQILPYPNNNTLYISWSPSDVNIKPMKYLENTNSTQEPSSIIKNSANLLNTSDNNRKKFLEISRNTKKQYKL